MSNLCYNTPKEFLRISILYFEWRNCIMKVYNSEQIRNVVLLGHGGVGKTTVAEAMLYASGAITRQGKVADGNTVSDFDPEESKRKFSINTSLIPVEWDNYKINILDTPGYFDFVGEVEQAITAADAGIIVVSAKSGVEVGTELAWQKLNNAGLPRFIFVNGMDDPEADLGRVLDQLREKFGNTIAPFHVPFKENGKFVGFVNVPKMQGRKYEGNTVVSCPIPDGMADDIEPVFQMVREAVASTDDELMERFFNEEDFTEEEIMTALQKGTMANEIVPVLVGCANNGTGIPVLLASIYQYFLPSIKYHAPKIGVDLAGNKVEMDTDDTGRFTAQVFKTAVDPFLGKITYFKVIAGSVKKDAAVWNANKDTEERLGKLYVMRGKEQQEVSELWAGDIGAVTKLSVTATGDTLCEKGTHVTIDLPTYSQPMMCMAVSPKNKGDEDKVSSSLNRIMEEDPTIKIVNDSEMKQQLIYGVGDQHLDVVVNKLMNKFKVAVELKKPKVSYRETIKGRVEVRGKHKKQSGGHGQYGDVQIIFEPSGDLTKPYVFEEKIFGGSVPKNYFPAVEKGIQESVKAGLLAGCPMVGLKATLTDGSYHPVDSSEMAFKTATQVAFKDGIPKANPVILEPIMSAKIIVDEEYMGDILGDMNKRRGRVLGMEHINNKQVIDAEVPMAEMFAYPTDLRSMTQGRGTFTMSFIRYEEANRDVMNKIIEEAKKEEA